MIHESELKEGQIYWIQKNLEGYTDGELEKEFEQYLNEEISPIYIGNVPYDVGHVLKKIDYTAFRTDFCEWLEMVGYIEIDGLYYEESDVEEALEDLEEGEEEE